jgi:hypothetical protein
LLDSCVASSRAVCCNLRRIARCLGCVEGATRSCIDRAREQAGTSQGVFSPLRCVRAALRPSRPRRPNPSFRPRPLRLHLPRRRQALRRRAPHLQARSRRVESRRARSRRVRKLQKPHPVRLRAQHRVRRRALRRRVQPPARYLLAQHRPRPLARILRRALDPARRRIPIRRRQRHSARPMRRPPCRHRARRPLRLTHRTLRRCRHRPRYPRGTAAWAVIPNLRSNRAPGTPGRTPSPVASRMKAFSSA